MLQELLSESPPRRPGLSRRAAEARVLVQMDQNPHRFMKPTGFIRKSLIDRLPECDGMVKQDIVLFGANGASKTLTMILLQYGLLGPYGNNPWLLNEFFKDFPRPAVGADPEPALLVHGEHRRQVRLRTGQHLPARVPYQWPFRPR